MVPKGGHEEVVCNNCIEQVSPRHASTSLSKSATRLVGQRRPERGGCALSPELSTRVRLRARCVKRFAGPRMCEMTRLLLRGALWPSQRSGARGYLVPGVCSEPLGEWSRWRPEDGVHCSAGIEDEERLYLDEPLELRGILPGESRACQEGTVKVKGLAWSLRAVE